ncbi:TPA: YnbE family lipoprotein [Photobacterium damselae]
MKMQQSVAIHKLTVLGAAVLITFALTGCTPTVQVAASDKPIEVNLNVKIEHEIRIKVDKEIDNLFKDEAVF